MQHEEQPDEYEQSQRVETEMGYHGKAPLEGVYRGHCIGFLGGGSNSPQATGTQPGVTNKTHYSPNTPREFGKTRRSRRFDRGCQRLASCVCPTMGSPPAPSMPPFPSGATTGHGEKWSRHAVSRPAGTTPERGGPERGEEGGQKINGRQQPRWGGPSSCPGRVSMLRARPRSGSAPSPPMTCRVSSRCGRISPLTIPPGTPGGPRIGWAGALQARRVQRAHQASTHWSNAG